MRIQNQVCLLTSAALGLALFTPNGTAQAITINNPGFEQPVFSAPNGGYPSDPSAYGNATSWSDGYYTGTGTTWTLGAADSGAINPGPTNYGYGGNARTGQQISYTDNYAGYGQGLSQILTTSIKPNTHYDLRAFAAYPVVYNGAGNVDYRLELLAGGSVLASTSGSVSTDTWTPVQVGFTSGATATGMLEIRLVATDMSVTGWEINWDDVSLTSCAVSASSTNYGTGLTGTRGIPTLLTSGAPKFGAKLTLMSSNSWPLPTAGLILIGISAAKAPFLGGTLLVTPLDAIGVSLSGKGMSVPFTVPSGCVLPLYLQVLQLDSGAAAGVSMTPGLRIQFGL